VVVHLAVESEFTDPSGGDVVGGHGEL
jgi:hypothetical protein